MMSLLEGLCFDKFAARAITLSVMAFEPFTARTADEAEGPSRNKQWYQRLGYVEFKVRVLVGPRARFEKSYADLPLDCSSRILRRSTFTRRT